MTVKEYPFNQGANGVAVAVNTDIGTFSLTLNGAGTSPGISQFATDAASPGSGRGWKLRNIAGAVAQTRALANAGNTTMCYRTYITTDSALPDQIKTYRTLRGGTNAGGAIALYVKETTGGRLVLFDSANANELEVLGASSPGPMSRSTTYRLGLKLVVNTTTPASGTISGAVYVGDSLTPLATIPAQSYNLGSIAITGGDIGAVGGASTAYTHRIGPTAYDDGGSTWPGPYVASGNSAPVVTAPASVRIATGSSVSGTMTTSDSDGTITGWSWAATSVPSGASVTWSGMTGSATMNTGTLTVPGVYVFTPSATDNGGASTTASTPWTVYVYPADGSFSIKAQRATTPAGATGAIANLADGDSATYTESAANASNQVTIYDMNPVADGDLTITDFENYLQRDVGSTATGTSKLEVLTGPADTVAASFGPLTVNPTTNAENGPLVLNSTQNTAFNNHSIWAIRITDNITP